MLRPNAYVLGLAPLLFISCTRPDPKVTLKIPTATLQRSVARVFPLSSRHSFGEVVVHDPVIRSNHGSAFPSIQIEFIVTVRAPSGPVIDNRFEGVVTIDYESARRELGFGEATVEGKVEGVGLGASVLSATRIYAAGAAHAAFAGAHIHQLSVQEANAVRSGWGLRSVEIAGAEVQLEFGPALE